MKSGLSIVAALLLAAAAVFGCSTPGQSGGWTTLLDGDKGMENWNRDGDANWRTEAGAVMADKGKGGFLVSKNDYKDFELYIEFSPDHTANSGIYMRCQDRNKLSDRSCYEANIFDQRPDPSYGTGGIVHRGSVSAPHKAGGKWNVYEIHVKGPVLTVKLNGVVTTSIVNSELTAPGPLALQFGNRGKEPGGAIRFRKVLIKPL